MRLGFSTTRLNLLIDVNPGQWIEELNNLILRKYYTQYKHDAKRRGLKFDLTFKEFEDVGGGYCYYCGKDILYIGLDRIDNNGGYTLENVVRCCEECNFMKHKMKQEEFINKCKLIAITHSEKLVA